MLGEDHRPGDGVPHRVRWNAEPLPTGGAAPVASLRATLERRPAPPTQVAAGPSTTAWVLSGAARYGLPTPTTPATVDASAPIEIDAGVNAVRIRMTGAGSLAVELDATTIRDVAGWAEITVHETHTRVTSAAGDVDIEPPRHVVLRGVDADTTVAIAVDQEPVATGASEVAWLARTIVDRLDTDVDGWRIPGSGPDRRLTTEVLAVPARSTPPGPHGGRHAELVGWLSDTWQRRIDSNEWHYISMQDTSPVAVAELDAYGRSGGLIVHLRPQGHDGEVPDGEGAPLAASEAWFPGARAAWVSARRNAETTLQQTAMAWYAALQQHVDRPATVPAISDLIDATIAFWHPAFGWHVDVAEVIVRGMNRYRYSDPRYPDRAPLAVGTLADQLAARGVESRPVVLS